MNMMDGLVILMFLMGVLLGLSQRLIRVLMSTLIASFTLIWIPAVYQEVGRFLSALLMAQRRPGDAVAFLLVALFSIIVLELVMRRSFKETFLPRIGVLDQIAGALVGLVWALLTACAALMPLAYVGSVSISSPVVAFMRAFFRPFATIVLRLLYPVGFAPILDQFVG